LQGFSGDKGQKGEAGLNGFNGQKGEIGATGKLSRFFYHHSLLLFEIPWKLLCSLLHESVTELH